MIHLITSSKLLFVLYHIFILLSITFVYALIGKEPYIMAAGGNLSSTLAIIITFMYLILYYRRRKIRVSKKQISPEKNNVALFIFELCGL